MLGVMRRIEIHLKTQEREAIGSFRFRGVHHAREVNRAHVLAALDRGVPDQQIQQVLGVSRNVIWRTRSAFAEKGLDYALKDLPRPGVPAQYQPTQQAEVVALACEPPPAGAKRWTLKTLTAAARQRPQLETVSRETIRRWLKKTF
jgi:transposase